MDLGLKQNARIDLKVDADIKLLAERAAAATGQTLSAYLLSLIRQDAPKVLAEQQHIMLSTQHYSDFMRSCEKSAQEWPYSGDELVKVAKQLDAESFQWR